MFDLRTIRVETGEQHRVGVDLRPQAFRLGGEPYVPLPSPLPGRLAVTRTRAGYVFDLACEAHVEGPCHRCLEPTAVPVEVRAQEYHAFAPDPGAEDDMTCEYLAEDVLDTDRWASDAIVLQMPAKVLCREDCAGLCPRCGADLNAGPCGCRPEETGDPRWHALRALLPPEA